METIHKVKYKEMFEEKMKHKQYMETPVGKIQRPFKTLNVLVCDCEKKIITKFEMKKTKLI